LLYVFNNNSQNYAEQRQFLMENFASKKKKSEIKSKQANVITMEGGA